MNNMLSINFHTPIHNLTRVGKATASRLKKLKINSAGNLLKHLPFRYDDLTKISTIDAAPENTVITLKANVEMLQNRRSPRKKIIITQGVISDETGSLKVVWFNQPYIAKTLETGEGYYFSGKIESDRYGRVLKNPNYEKIKDVQTHAARIIPVYPATSGITQKQIRFLIYVVLPLTRYITDWIPEKIKQELHLLDLKKAWKEIHFPSNQPLLERAIRRLKFDELFLIQLYNQKTCQEFKSMKALPIEFKQSAIKNFVNALPFALTADQKKAAWEIIQDMKKKEPMNRLLEGEVGSGKTVVATMAMYNCNLNGYQSVFMAPTEILAFQHYQTIKKLLGPCGIKIGLLSNAYCESINKKNDLSMKKRREKMVRDIQNGKIQIIIGTHSLIQENIHFENLGLAIIDEQHRFGVKQRKTLREAGSDPKFFPHFLSMTATPIPRSLALSFYGDLDLSLIRQLPKSRIPISTHLIKSEQRKNAYDFIRKEIRKGRQVFVICPLIEESDTLGVKSVKQEYEKLKTEIFPDLKIGLLHGKLKSEEKEDVMENFKKQKINIMVATSVVEVGVDIPNATIMMIEGAARFGLAQLHQFRGRVGRGEHKSYCFLFLDNENSLTYQRLSLLKKYNDGFSLAEQDLALRGPGNIYGAEQSGFISLKIATWYDHDIMLEAKKQAEKILKQDPALESSPMLQKKLQTFEKSIHLE